MLQVVLLRFEQRGGILVDGDGGDFVPLGDFVHHILPHDDFAEDGMLSVEVRGWEVGDEELAAIGVRTRIGHREDAGLVVLERAVNLIRELVARAAGTGARWVAALNHEVGDHAVEGDAVIVATLCKIKEIRRRDRDLGGEEPGVDVADGGVNGDFDIRHAGQVALYFRVGN